jgi:hypothetical protein
MAISIFAAEPADEVAIQKMEAKKGASIEATPDWIQGLGWVLRRRWSGGSKSGDQGLACGDAQTNV